MPAAFRAAALAAAIVAAGCGILPGTELDGGGIHPQVGRGGLDVAVRVPGWAPRETRAYLCASRTPEAELQNFSTGNSRRDCLELDVVHDGLGLLGTYSFRDASAVRRAAFDASPDWFLVLSWQQRGGGLAQVQARVPGGPVLVE